MWVTVYHHMWLFRIPYVTSLVSARAVLSSEPAQRRPWPRHLPKTLRRRPQSLELSFVSYPRRVMMKRRWHKLQVRRRHERKRRQREIVKKYWDYYQRTDAKAVVRISSMHSDVCSWDRPTVISALRSSFLNDTFAANLKGLLDSHFAPSKDREIAAHVPLFSLRSLWTPPQPQESTHLSRRGSFKKRSKAHSESKQARKVGAYVSPEKREINHLKAGLTAGVITAAVTHLYDGHGKRFSNSAGFVSGTKGGIAMFRPGFSPAAFFRTLHTVMPSVGMYFTVFEYSKNRLLHVKDPHERRATQLGAWMASAFAGAFVGHMLAKPTMLIPFRYAVQFGVFEAAKDFARYAGRDPAKDSPRKLGPLAIMTTAALGGVGAHSFIYPLSRIRHRLLAQPTVVPTGQGTLETVGFGSRLRSAIAATPPSALYQGWRPALVRFLPPCVITATSYEFALRFICSRDRNE